MTKKLQVFISSTYTDLRDERQAAVEAVLLAGHIPAGMELFGAGDATQLEVIKNWIIESDVYLLILGARYGSVEPISKIGYTEVEYDFAVENNKPHFALVLSEEANNRKRAEGLVSAEDDHKLPKLDEFRKKVLAKASSFADDPKDIKIGVLQSLKAIEGRQELIGWVRPTAQPSLEPLLTQISRLTQQNEELQEKLAHSVPKQGEDALNIADLGDEFQFTIAFAPKGYGERTISVKMSWKKLFGMIGMKLLEMISDQALNSKIAAEIVGRNGLELASSKIVETDWETIRAQFLAYDLVKIEYLQTLSKSLALFWSLTEYGRKMALALRVVQKSPSNGIGLRS